MLPWAGGAGVSPLLTSLVAYWKLDEASGARADSAGSSNLSDVNTVTQAVGKVANAAQFTAANSECLNIASNAALSMGDIDFTIALWVYFDALGADRALVAKYNSFGTTRDYMVKFITGSNRFQFIVSPDGSADATVSANSFGAPTTATWYFIVAWHNATANTINIQINDGTVDSAAHATGVFASSAAFRLGARADGIQFHDGRLDEVGIWKRVLTSAERTALYNGGSGVTYPFAGT